MIGSERALSKRLTWERERLRWSYEGLASRMTLAGCAIQSSALYKIEKGDPPRRITVDELVALARVFEMDVEELLRPLEVVLHEEIEKMAATREAAWDAVNAALHGWREATREHLTLYRRASLEGNDGLVTALDAYDEEARARIHEQVRRLAPGELDKKLAGHARELTQLSPEQRTQRGLDDRVEGAIERALDEIEDVVKDEVWGPDVEHPEA